MSAILRRLRPICAPWFEWFGTSTGDAVLTALWLVVGVIFGALAVMA